MPWMPWAPVGPRRPLSPRSADTVLLLMSIFWIAPFLICGLPTLFFGSALTAAKDVPPSAKNRARYATKWPRTCFPISFKFPPWVQVTRCPPDGGPARFPRKDECGVRRSHGYDELMSQLTPEVDPNEPPQLPRDFRDYEPIQPRGTDWREVRRKIWAPFAAIGAFIAKFGVGILKFKFLFGLFISFGAYLWYGGVAFAIGLIGLIFIHEMGHWLQAKRQGLPVSAPLFIPLLGASIFLKEHPESAWREFQLAIAGPLLGSLGALGVYAVAVAEDSNRLRAIAFLGFFINLFNLLPVVPLDGGRIVAAIHPALWVLGLVALLALVIFRPNGILVLILVFAGLELWQRWKTRQLAGSGAYYSVLPWQRLTAAVSYFGLAALLVLGMHATHVPHQF